MNPHPGPYGSDSSLPAAAERTDPAPSPVEETSHSREDAQGPETGTNTGRKRTPGEGFREFLSLLSPRKGYLVTPLLLYVNVAVYVLMTLSGVNPMDPSVEDLIRWGANTPASLLGGEYWRLLTACFVHIGLLHLVMNMYALLYIGLFLEQLIGSGRFLFAYLVTGLVSSLVSVTWHDNMVGAGASGAIFGLYGLFVAVLLAHRSIDPQARKAMLTSVLIFIGYNLLYGLRGEVDNAAHLGGLIGGLAVGAVWLPVMRKQAGPRMRDVLVWIVPLGLLCGTFAVCEHLEQRRNPYAGIEAFLGRVSDIERRAIAEYSDGENLTLRQQIEENRAYLLHIDSCVTEARQALEQQPDDPANTEMRLYLRNILEYYRNRQRFSQLFIECSEAGTLEQCTDSLETLVRTSEQLLYLINQE